MHLYVKCYNLKYSTIKYHVVNMVKYMDKSDEKNNTPKPKDYLSRDQRYPLRNYLPQRGGKDSSAPNASNVSAQRINQSSKQEEQRENSDSTFKSPSSEEYITFSARKKARIEVLSL